MEILPFKGLHYTKKAGNIQDLITQPYDKITPKMQEEYYKVNSNNAIRVELGKDFPGDSDTENKYTRADCYFKVWMAEGVLERDDEPAIYIYNQEYPHPDTGEVKIRQSFIACGKLHEYEEKIVYPHEHTLSGPKQDRLMLMRHTKTNTGLVLVFYRDDQNDINKVLSTQTKGEPMFDAVDEYKTHHKIWKITDKQVIGKIQELMNPKTTIICDGHHRYETALNYRNEMRKKHPSHTGNECWNYRMMAFVNQVDPNLYVFPTHRVIRDVPGFDAGKLLEKLAKDFDITEVPMSGNEVDTAKKLNEMMKANIGKHAFGFYAKGAKSMQLLTLKSDSIADALPISKSNDWKRLDVTVLHKIILEPLLGIDDAKLAAQTNVDYERYIPDAVEPVAKGTHQCVFLLNPTLTDQVEAVTKHFETMPQKSTDYFPKVQSALIIQYLPDGEQLK